VQDLQSLVMSYEGGTAGAPRLKTKGSHMTRVHLGCQKPQPVQMENLPMQNSPANQAQGPGNDPKNDTRTDTGTASLKDLDVNSSEQLSEHAPVRRMDSQTSEVDEFHDAEP